MKCRQCLERDLKMIHEGKEHFAVCDCGYRIEMIEKGGKQMKKDKGRYMVRINCMNCKESADWAIQNGKRVGDFLKGKKCNLCGCNFVVSKTTHFSVTNNREEKYREYMGRYWNQ